MVEDLMIIDFDALATDRDLCNARDQWAESLDAPATA